MPRRMSAEKFLDLIEETDTLGVDVPSSPEFTNQLLLKLLQLSKSQLSMQGSDLEWDSRQVMVAVGTTPTKLLDVFDGDVIAVRLTNWDVDDCKPVYYAMERGVKPPYTAATFPAGTGQARVGHLLNAGETRALQATRDVYAILDTTATVAVPVLVEFAKIRRVNRKAGGRRI